MQPSSAAGRGQADLQGACIHRVWGEGSLQLQVRCSPHAAAALLQLRSLAAASRGVTGTP